MDDLRVGMGFYWNRWTAVNVTVPLVSLDKAKLTKWQERDTAGWQGAAVYWVHLPSSFTWLVFTEAADAHHRFIYIGPSCRCPGVIISSTLLAWCYHSSSWFDMASHRSVGSCEVENAGQFISPPLERDSERPQTREEWVVMVSGWWDERQMVFCWSGSLAEQLGSPRVTEQALRLSKPAQPVRMARWHFFRKTQQT